MPCKPAATAKTAGHPRLTPARSFRDDIAVVGADVWTGREVRMVSERMLGRSPPLMLRVRRLSGAAGRAGEAG